MTTVTLTIRPRDVASMTSRDIARLNHRINRLKAYGWQALPWKEATDKLDQLISFRKTARPWRL